MTVTVDNNKCMGYQLTNIIMRTIKFRALKDDMSNCNFVYGELVYDALCLVFNLIY